MHPRRLAAFEYARDVVRAGISMRGVEDIFTTAFQYSSDASQMTIQIVGVDMLDDLV
ncbi:methyltransferase type 11 domain protein [Mycobacterium kansasii 824]|nr:methyltransferase type 11 domain protein [Mycobacterium kansasii 824]